MLIIFSHWLRKEIVRSEGGRGAGKMCPSGESRNCTILTAVTPAMRLRPLLLGYYLTSFLPQPIKHNFRFITLRFQKYSASNKSNFYFLYSCSVYLIIRTHIDYYYFVHCCRTSCTPDYITWRRLNLFIGNFYLKLLRLHQFLFFYKPTITWHLITARWLLVRPHDQVTSSQLLRHSAGKHSDCSNNYL